MDSLSRHFHQLVGLNDDWAIGDVQLDTAAQTLTLPLEFVGSRVTCPECGASSAMKDHAPERRWRHLDAMQFQTILTAQIPRCSCDTCGVKTVAVPWRGHPLRLVCCPLIATRPDVDAVESSQDVVAGQCHTVCGLRCSSIQVLERRAACNRGSSRPSSTPVPIRSHALTSESQSPVDSTPLTGIQTCRSLACASCL